MNTQLSILFILLSSNHNIYKTCTNKLSIKVYDMALTFMRRIWPARRCLLQLDGTLVCQRYVVGVPHTCQPPSSHDGHWVRSTLTNTNTLF